MSLLPIRGLASLRPSLLRGRGASPLRVAPAILLVLALTACDFDTAAKKTILGLNELQDGAFLALKDARGQVVAAGLKCGELARLQIPPVTPSPEACKAIGSPLPFDPVKLNDAIAVGNAAYEAIRGANEARLALKAGTGAKADVILAIGHAIAAVTRLGTAARDLGVPFDDTELKRLTDFWNGRQGP